MYKRLMKLMVIALMAIFAISIFSSPPANAAKVQSIFGKTGNESLPEIKCVDGDAGDSAYGKVRVGFLTSQGSTSSVAKQDLKTYNSYNSIKIDKDFINKYLARTIIFNLLVIGNLR